MLLCRRIPVRHSQASKRFFMSSFTIPPHPEYPILPIVGGGGFPVRRIYCVGRNYHDHIQEMGGDPRREQPFFFSKPLIGSLVPCAYSSESTTILPYPLATTNLHYEVELVVAIGAGSTFCYGVGIDLTRRDLQSQAKTAGRPWCAAKGFDASGPIGLLYPHPTMPIGDIWLTVNGVERQRGNPAKEMIWSVDEILRSLAQQVNVCPGDLIFTGTPAGVGPLHVGDEVVAGMQDCGEISFKIGPALTPKE